MKKIITNGAMHKSGRKARLIMDFYERILNGVETPEDVEKFNGLCMNYSDMYKDVYGFRPRSEMTMCVNGYSGTPDIEKFRELLKQGINPLAELERAYDDAIDDYQDDYADFEEGCFMDSNPSKEEILDKHPEYEKYFV